MLIKSNFVHIDTADNVSMTCEATFSACPISSFGLVPMPTYRTLAACSSFGASEALDVSGFRFMDEIVNVLAIFPQRHALVMVSPTLTVTDTVGIANEERAKFMV
jgi:hypothetical protein